MDDLGDLRDVGVEHAQRVGVGQHQAGDRVVGLGPEVVEVHPAVGVGADLDDRHARHRHRRRVGPVRGVGGQHLGPDLPAVLVEGARQEHARQLAVRPGARLQRDVRQAGDLAQRALQVVHQLQRALRALRRLQRVQPRVTGERGDPLVQPRVVLHRARPERVEARVEIEVATRELDVVTDQLGLGDLGQARDGVTAQGRRQQLGGLDLGNVERGRDERPAPRGALLEDRRRAVALHRRGALRDHPESHGATRCASIPGSPWSLLSLKVVMLTPPPWSALRRPQCRAPRPAGRCRPWSAARSTPPTTRPGTRRSRDPARSRG